MFSRITAEFNDPDTAEIALRRVKESVRGIVRTGMSYNKISDKAERMKGGSIYTILPTGLTMQNYMTAVMESPASVDTIPEPYRRRNTKVYIICASESCGSVTSILGSMGGLGIKSVM